MSLILGGRCKFPILGAARLLRNTVDRLRGVESLPVGREHMESSMCDFSLQSVQSRPAKVGDKLVTRDFGTGTRGFADVDNLGIAVCLMPGTELAFAGEVACLPAGLLGWKTKTINHQTAIFRQVNKERWPRIMMHSVPDGRIVLLTLLCEGGGECVAAAGAAEDRGRGARPGTRRLCRVT